MKTMKVFSNVCRDVPKHRRKFGKQETKKEMLLRLKEEREIKEKKNKLVKEVEEKNKDEFHFGYYSVNKNMTKKIEHTKDELKKTLKYVESEIKRVEKNVTISFKKEKLNNKVVFSDDGDQTFFPNTIKITKNEYEKYIEELKSKQLQIYELLGSYK